MVAFQNTIHNDVVDLKMKILFAVSILTNIAIAVWALYAGIAADPELANKPEWNALQYLESKHRDGPSEPNVILIKNLEDTGYDAAGIFDAKTSKRFWILTNSKISPKIKLMPKPTEITLSDDQVKMILEGVTVNDEVKSFLTIKRR